MKSWPAVAFFYTPAEGFLHKILCLQCLFSCAFSCASSLVSLVTSLVCIRFRRAFIVDGRGAVFSVCYISIWLNAVFIIYYFDVVLQVLVFLAVLS